MTPGRKWMRLGRREGASRGKESASGSRPGKDAGASRAPEAPEAPEEADLAMESAPTEYPALEIPAGAPDTEAPPETRPGERPAPTPEERAAEYLDQLQRMKAEFDNYRKRVFREREDWSQAVRADVARQLLPALDDMRRARAHQQGSPETADVTGLFLILKRIEDVLNQLGLREQETTPGAPFDPELHEAVMTAPSEDVPEGSIVQVVEPGYLFGDRLLRPSKVVVSSRPAAG
jgi:molecular chaperone GrpE